VSLGEVHDPFVVLRRTAARVREIRRFEAALVSGADPASLQGVSWRPVEVNGGPGRSSSTDSSG
jgi:hypothetical protein